VVVDVLSEGGTVLADGVVLRPGGVIAMMLVMMSSSGGEVQYRRDRGMCAQTMR